MNNSNNVLSIISPQWGTAGTDINLLKIAEKFVKDGFDVRLLSVGDEWDGRKVPSEIKKIYLIPKFIFKLIKNKYIYWKITMSLSVIFSIVPLILYILRYKSNYILGLVPILGIFGQ